MKNRFFYTLIKMIILLIASTIIGIGLLIVAYCFPTDRIKSNVEKSVDLLAQEGDHFSGFHGVRFMDQDNYSDALYLNGAMVDNRAKGIFTGLYGLEYENANAVISYDSPVTLLKNVFLDDASLEYKEYGRRFWNGYEIILKPLLTFFSYGQIRYINFYLELFLLFLLAALMYRRNLKWYIIPIAVSYLFLGPVTMPFSMAFGGFIYCTYIPCILMLIFNDTFIRKHLYPLFFMAVGICAAYFNMNYFQLITFAYALLFYYLLNGFPKSVKSVVANFVIMLACWLCGFDGMYVMKWITYELLTGQPLISDMITRALYRVSATAYYTGPEISRLGAMCKNFYYIVTNGPWMLLELGYVLWAIVKMKKENTKIVISDRIKFTRQQMVLFLLMTVLVFSRYLIFANHVYVHAWTTYRIADAMVLSFNFLVMDFTLGDVLRNEKIRKVDED